MKKIGLLDMIVRSPAAFMLRFFPMGPLFMDKYSRYARHMYKSEDRLCLVGDYPLYLNLNRGTDLRRFWDLWEPDMRNYFYQFLKLGMTFLDVGAHKGTYSMMAASLVGPKGLVVAVEPKAENCEAFTQALKAFELTGDRTRVVLLHSALSSNPGTATLSVIGTHIVDGDEKTNTFSAEATTLDNIVGEYGPFDLIKIDTDGHEMDIILGAANLLKDGLITNIIVEVSNLAYQDKDSLLSKLETFLGKFGFELSVLNYKGRPVELNDIPSWHRSREMHVLFHK